MLRCACLRASYVAIHAAAVPCLRRFYFVAWRSTAENGLGLGRGVRVLLQNAFGFAFSDFSPKHHQPNMMIVRDIRVPVCKQQQRGAGAVRWPHACPRNLLLANGYGVSYHAKTVSDFLRDDAAVQFIFLLLIHQLSADDFCFFGAATPPQFNSIQIFTLEGF